MEKFNLFDVMYNFVKLFLNGENLTYEPLIQLVAMTLSVAFFYGVIIRPVLYLFGIKGRK